MLKSVGIMALPLAGTFVSAALKHKNKIPNLFFFFFFEKRASNKLFDIFLVEK